MASSEPAGATTQPAAEPDFADFSGFEGAIAAPADEFADFSSAPPAEPEAPPPAATPPPAPTTPAATQPAAAAPPAAAAAAAPGGWFSAAATAATAELTSVQKRAAETLATPSMPSLSGLGDMLSPVNVGKNISATLDQAEKQLSTATSSMKEQISTATSSIVPPSLAKLPSLNSVGLPVARLPTTEAEKFDALMEAGEIEKAARYAATSPKQELRTLETVRRFQAAAAPAGGGKAPILVYFGALLGRKEGSLTHEEGLELAKPMVAQVQLSLRQRWLAEGKLQPSE